MWVDWRALALQLALAGVLFLQGWFGLKVLRTAGTRSDAAEAPSSQVAAARLAVWGAATFQALLIAWSLLWLRQADWQGRTQVLGVISLCAGSLGGLLFAGGVNSSLEKAAQSLGTVHFASFIVWGRIAGTAMASSASSVTPWPAVFGLTSFGAGCLLLSSSCRLSGRDTAVIEVFPFLSLMTLYGAAVVPILVFDLLAEDRGWLLVPLIEGLLGVSLLFLWAPARLRASRLAPCRWASTVPPALAVFGCGLLVASVAQSVSLLALSVLIVLPAVAGYCLYAVLWAADSLRSRGCRAG
jgi:hypothetical protein